MKSEMDARFQPNGRTGEPGHPLSVGLIGKGRYEGRVPMSDEVCERLLAGVTGLSEESLDAAYR